MCDSKSMNQYACGSSEKSIMGLQEWYETYMATAINHRTGKLNTGCPHRSLYKVSLNPNQMAHRYWKRKKHKHPTCM